MSTESSRFQHLLQPIRDLSKNWNIDLAQELEEYLDALEHLTIAFDATGVAGEGPSAPSPSSSTKSVQLMNFAEAALLIQGTSLIYSRKVEYLYALVFQTLAHLSKQQEEQIDEATRRRHRQQQPGEHGDDDGDGANGEDADPARADPLAAHLDILANPLPIYEGVEEARHITLRTTPTATGSQQAPRRATAHAIARAKHSLQASMALMGSLVPDERDHGETFKLLSCTLHPSGVLLLDDASKRYLADEAGSPLPPTQTMGPLVATPMKKIDFDGGLDDDDDDDDDAMVDGGPDFDIGGFDDDGGDHPQMDHHPDDGEALELGPNDEVETTGDGNGPESELTSSFPGIEDPFLADEHVARTTNGTPSGTRASYRQTTNLAEVVDPWAPLDPYDASKSTVRAFRKGRSYSARSAKKLLSKGSSNPNDDGEDGPCGVDDPAFKERFLLDANRPQWSTWVWTDLDDRSLERKVKKKYCKAPCLLTSCDGLWRLETKWSSLMRRAVAAEAQSAQAILLQEQAEEEEEQMHAMTRDGGEQQLESTASNADIDAMVDGANDDDDDDDEGVEMGDHGVEFDGGEDPWSALSPALKRNSIAGTFQDIALTYEEICRQHLEEFMKGTEQYIRETDLTRQVNDWQEKLAPILKEQDAHPPFDIHHYGREILGHLKVESARNQSAKQNRKRKSASTEEDAALSVAFEDIVSGKNHFEVCRMFLASLQLANSGNIQLVHASTAAEQSTVPFEMQLLTTSNVYESLQVPSTA